MTNGIENSKNHSKDLQALIEKITTLVASKKTGKELDTKLDNIVEFARYVCSIDKCEEELLDLISQYYNSPSKDVMDLGKALTNWLNKHRGCR